MKYDSPKAPIIIGGCMRSGTTLFSTMLDTHRNIACGYETELLIGRRAVKNILYKLRISYEIDDIFTQKDLSRIQHRLLEYPNIDSEKLHCFLKESGYSRSTFARLFFQSYLIHKNKTRWADKTPGNTFFIKSLSYYYPEAKFIHIVRDFRDFYLSYKKYRASLNQKTSIFSSAYYWNRNNDFIKQATTIQNPILIIRYEDLIVKTETTLKKVFCFLNEEFDPNCLKYYLHKHDKEDKEHVEKIKHPIDRNNIEKYKKTMTDAEKRISLLLCGKLLRYYGYEK